MSASSPFASLARRHQLDEQSAESNRFAAEFASHEIVAARRRVALGEHEVDDGEHGIESIGELGARRARDTEFRASRIFPVARTSRCAIVGTGTRNARAISSVVRPQIVRSVSATCASRASAGWQQVKISRSRSSSTPLSSSSARDAIGARRRRRPASAISGLARASRRRRSMARKRAVLISHVRGFVGNRVARRPLLHRDGERVLHGLLGEVEIAEEADERREDASRTPRDRCGR